MRLSISFAVLVTVFVRQSLAVASYDEYRDADVEQSGYLPNHNMDPSIVDSASFGQIWKVAFNNLEKFYAKPLTYTPLAGGNQLLFLASSQNWIRTLDAKTGALINARQVNTPFLQSDIGCGDIPNTIGITGTPVIDPTTDIVYFFSKTYIPNFRVAGDTGIPNGVYYFHGVNINTLADAFPPILIDGTNADNAPAKYFNGGIVLQRPSLTQIGSVVYGAFGAHCDDFNYTGLVVGVDINQQKVITEFAVESGPLVAQTNSLLGGGGGGQGGIWMGGMGLASDGERLFFVSANGDGHQNQGAPASGSSPLQTLGETASNLAIDSTTGKLSLADYFQPYDYINMDAGDLDYGSGGIVLLDPVTFSGGGISRMAVTAGKNGKVYILNADNLGGYKLGPGQSDGNLQTIVTNEAVFGAAGSYPLEGGYIYLSPVGHPLYCYQLGFTASGLPELSQVAETSWTSGAVGVGIPTITTLNNQPGTAIVWMTDPSAGLMAWYAIPQNGVLVNIKLPQLVGANKFQRPAFGDGRVYTTDSNGVLYCLGAPVSLPLNCTDPVNFGQVALGTTATQTVTCTANIAITSVVGLEIGQPSFFTASNSSLPTSPLKAGQSFSFPVTWNLTAVNTSSSNAAPGVKSSPLSLFTINSVAGYSTLFPVSLTGTEVSTAPFLSVGPNTVDFGGVVVTNPDNLTNIEPESDVVTIANKGLAAMTILGYAYTLDYNNPTWVNATSVDGVWDLGYGFTSTALPDVGSQLAATSSVSVEIDFFPLNGTGSYVSYWQIWSDGGNVNTVLEGIASTAPVANFSISTTEGGWLPPSELTMDFGDVAPGSSSSLQIRICNEGGSSLSIDKSKPPFGVFHISDPEELAETQIIAPGDCAYGTVLFNPNTEEYDIPNYAVNNTWTLNTNDLNFGVHVVEIVGTVVDATVGPVNSTTGETIYQYLGCFAESTTGPRLFTNEPVSPSNANDNGYCQTQCYGAAKYAFAGTEYADECWCGNTPPPLASQDLTDVLCNMACPADGNDRCGGTGYISVYYDPTKYVAGTNPALYGPQTIQAVGKYIFQGCYSEATNGRALSALTPTPPTGGFNIELCEAACAGYTYFGMEYSNQCYCGNSLGAGSVNQTSLVPATSGCDMICTGNTLEYCGGPGRLNLYMLNGTISTSTSSSLSTSSSTVSTGTLSISTTLSTSTLSSPTTMTVVATPTGPITVTNIPGWTYLGCYSEATTGRALSGNLLPITTANTDVNTCAAACAAYTYFGVEYGQECYCGNVINAGSVNQTSSVPAVNGCSMTCALNPNQYCGGRSRLNMYQAAPLVSSSSSSLVSTSTTSASSTSLSSTQSRTSTIPSSSSTSSTTPSSVLSSSTSISTSSVGSSTTSSTSSSSAPSSTSTSSSSSVASSTTSSTSTSSSSIESSTSSSATSSSVVLSSISTSSISSTSSSTSSSATVSTSSSLRTSTISTSSSTSSSSSTIPSKSSSISTIISTSSATSTTSSSVSTTTSSGPIPSWTGTLTPGQMIGSWQYLGCANEVSGRALTGSSYTSNNAMTIEACSAYCAENNYVLAGLEYSSQCYCSNELASPSAVGLTTCSMACSGNTAEICGGSNLISVFNNTAYVYPSSPETVGSYTYLACYHEATTGRLLSGPSYSDPVNMTVESCTSFCQSNMPNGVYAGVEYSQECYCSATLPTAGVIEAPGTCSMLCKGNNKEFCGGNSLLNVYEYEAPARKFRRRFGSL